LVIRPRPLLTFFALLLAPLLLLALVNYWLTVAAADRTIETGLQGDLNAFRSLIDRTLDEQIAQLKALSEASAMQRYAAGNDAGVSPDLENALTLLLDRGVFERIICHDRKRIRFVAEARSSGSGTPSAPITIHTRDFLPDLPRADKVWEEQNPTGSFSPFTSNASGASVLYALPVFSPDGSEVTAAVVGQLRLDTVLAQAAKPIEAKSGSMVIVLDRSRRLLYHPNDSLKHQQIDSALPNFLPVASAMAANESGSRKFLLSTGEEYLAAFGPAPRLNAAAAVARSRSAMLSPAKRSGWLGVALALGIAIPAAIAIDRFWQRRSRGMDRVAEGVSAIAKGELDRQIVVSSDDGARIIADSINVINERYREQLARDAEARQLESFVRLSAMLTHDLKNAIEALSLIVGNMEVHFDNKEFRADMMKSLTLATEKLKGLVTRISNPVTTLSGEHKLPKPVDLVAALKRVLALIPEPVRAKYQIELKVPENLHALVDPERFDRVIENLLLNAIEAMGEKGGKLTIEVGKAEADKVFLSVSDTGQGMSQEFIDNRLFRPFATTKRSGVGLGLYTCREVIRANGGVIDVQSKQGVGTTFRVMLPSAAVEGRN
jgi:signal transduction histidine kinase